MGSGKGTRRLHISWHIAGLSAGLLTGVALAALTGAHTYAIGAIASQAAWLALVVALLLVVIGLRKRTAASAVLFICAGLLIGLWRSGSEQQALTQYVPYYGQTVVVQGRISEDVTRDREGDIRMQLVAVRVSEATYNTHNDRTELTGLTGADRQKPKDAGRPDTATPALPGKIWASATINSAINPASTNSINSNKGESDNQKTNTTPTIKRNDTVWLTGKLDEGFGNIAASMGKAQLIRLQQTSQNDTALQVRDWFSDGIRQAIPEPQASLGSGFLTGQHSSLPAELDEQLRIVGLTHAVVASGSNLTVLVGFTRRLFNRVSKYTATMAGTAMTAAFIMVAGMSPSMTRAGLVTGLSLAAWYYGRRVHPLVLLPLAAAITVFANPSYLWGDIGWYLSFTAFAGVLILAPLLQSYFWGKDYKPNLLMEILIGTTAAQIATMPVILFSFGTYSSYALLANMLVLPLVPLAMLLTFIGGIAGVALSAMAHSFAFVQPAVQWIGWPATIVMQYMTTVIDRVASLPGAQGEIAYGKLALIGSYTLLILAIAYMWRKTGHNFRRGGNIVIGERA